MELTRREVVRLALAGATTVVWSVEASAEKSGSGIAVAPAATFLRGQCRAATGAHGEALLWPQSYVPTHALNLGQTGFTYDAALAVLALIGAGDTDTARKLGNAMLYVQANDPDDPDGRIRDSYAADSFVTRSGGVVYDDVAADTGNMCWAGLALLRLYDVTSDSSYLEGARRIGHWLRVNVVVTPGSHAPDIAYGLRGGFDSNNRRETWKSTEHNADANSFFLCLAVRDGANAAAWQRVAVGATRFLGAVKQKDGHLAVGTTDSNTTINQDMIALDAQSFPMLSLPTSVTADALGYARRHLHTVGNPAAYAFSGADRSGIWYEGTAQMATVVATTYPDVAHYTALSSTLQAAQWNIGAVPAASKDGLRTGDDGDAYYRAAHVGATAWAMLAALQVNPLATP